MPDEYRARESQERDLALPSDRLEALQEKLRRTEARLEQERERRRQVEGVVRQTQVYMDAIHGVTSDMISGMAPQAVLTSIVNLVTDFARTSHGFFFAYDEEVDRLVLKVGVGIYRDAIGYRVARGEGLAGKVWESGEPMAIDDYPRWEGRHPDPYWDPVQSIAGIPLRFRGRFLGVLGLLHEAPGLPIDRQAFSLLKSLAQLASVALDNTQLYVQLQQEMRERSKAEQALRTNEHRYRSVVEDMTEFVMRWRPDGTALFVNKCYCRYKDKPPEAIVGKNLFDLFSDKARRQALEIVERLSPAHPTEVNELMTEGPDGRPIWEEWVDRGLFDDRGRLIEVQSIGRDITERERLRGQLLQAQKMEAIGTLAGGIAHDFNNILTAIMGNVDIALITDLEDHHPARRSLEKIGAAAERAARLVHQILTFSRTRGQVLAAVDLTAVVRDLVNLLRSTLPSTIDIQWNSTVEHAVIRADPVQCQQVLMNLGTNAAHAMRRRGGKLTIDLKPEVLDDARAAQYETLTPGEYLRLDVTDTGEGMVPEVRERIFEPYFTTKDAREGTGLGLAVVHGIVSRMNGAIAVDSAPGRGTRFRLLFPVSGGPLDGSAAPRGMTPESGGDHGIRR